MAAYKSEFLAQRYKRRLHPIHHYVFGFADKLARWGSLAPALTNALLTGPLTSPLIKHIVGVAQQRELPTLAAKSYQKATASSVKSEGTSDSPHIQDEKNNGALQAAKKLHPVKGTGFSPYMQDGKNHGALAPEGPALQQVILWPDTWNNYYHPQTLIAAETVLTQAGFQVQTPQGHICCGRPLYDFGHLDAARSYLANVLGRMAPQIDAGLPFIFLEPSCASVFKDELPELFPHDSRAQRMRDQVWLLADWLFSKAPDYATGRLQGAHILIHGHCHHKAVFGGPASEIALLRQAGATVDLIEAGCCGMAGPFGFEADKFEVSKTIANQGLLPAIQAAGPMTIVVADGFSCREQIAQLGHKQALHFAEVLAHGCGCSG